MKIPTTASGGVSLPIVGIFKVADTPEILSLHNPTIASDEVSATNENPNHRQRWGIITNSWDFQSC